MGKIKPINQDQTKELIGLSAKNMPNDPSARGWTADQVRRKFYEPIIWLWEFLQKKNEELQGLEQVGDERLESLTNLISETDNARALATTEEIRNAIETAVNTAVNIANEYSDIELGNAYDKLKAMIDRLNVGIMTGEIDIIKETIEGILTDVNKRLINKTLMFEETEYDEENEIQYGQLKLDDEVLTYSEIEALLEDVNNDVVVFWRDGKVILNPSCGDGVGMIEFTNTYYYNNEIWLMRITINRENVCKYEGIRMAKQEEVDAIKSMIPAQANATNQLADKDFVNSSVATNTAHFRGTFTDTSMFPINGNTPNDYAYLKVIDSTTNLVKQYDRYKWDNGVWGFEYTLNNSSFTSEQWKAINSGITEELVGKIHDIPKKVSAFENDVGYLTEHQDISMKANTDYVNQEDAKSLYNLGAFDTYSENGDVVTITRKTIKYNLSELTNWGYDASNKVFYCPMYGTNVVSCARNVVPNLLSTDYSILSVDSLISSQEKSISYYTYDGINYIHIKNTSITNIDNLKNDIVNQYIYLETSTSYEEKVIKGTRNNAVDNWARDEYEKTINLLDAHFPDVTYQVSITIGRISLKAGTYTYRVTSNENAGANTLIIGTYDVSNGGHSLNTPITFTLTEDVNNAEVKAYFNASNRNVKIMLNKGTEALPYKPYEGKVLHESNVKLFAYDVIIESTTNNGTPFNAHFSFVSTDDIDENTNVTLYNFFTSVNGIPRKSNGAYSISCSGWNCCRIYGVKGDWSWYIIDNDHNWRPLNFGAREMNGVYKTRIL